MKKTTLWFSVLMLAFIVLSCVKDPQAPVHHKEDPIEPNVPSGGLQTLPYTQSFVTDFGTYMAYDVFGESKSWMIDDGAAMMTGYISSDNTYSSNEDWLISSPVAITGVDNAKVSLTYSQQNSSGISNGITLQVSSDYAYGIAPSAAIWTEMPVEFSNTSGTSDFTTVDVSLNDFIGQNVTIAIKYITAEAPSCLVRIKSITVQEGEVGSSTLGGEIQSLPYSQSFASEFGTYMAYDVSGPQSWMIDFSTAKMSGYSSQVNYSNEDWLISSPVDLSGVSDAKMTITYIGRYFDNINEDVTIWASTNYNWGDSTATASWTRIYANLTEGTNWNDFLTTEIALTEIVGQTVTLAVKYVSYDGKSLAGTLEIQSITIEEGTVPGGDVPTPPPTPGGEIFSETFANGQGDFVIQDVIRPEELGFIWVHNSNNALMKASAYYSGQSYASESWLVSPAIDLTGVATASLSFDQACNYYSPPQDFLSVMISNNCNGDVTTADWTVLNLDSWPPGSDWVIVSSTADLTPHVGNIVTIAFKYTSDQYTNPTWEVKNIVVQ